MTSTTTADGGGTELAEHPKLAEGTELLGEYAGSGYREPHYMARRPNGQVVQLSHLLFLIASEMDGRRGVDDIADRVSSQVGKRLSGKQAGALIKARLAPLGLVADGTEPERLDLLLALKFKARAIPERFVQPAAALLRPLFWTPVVVAVVAAWAAVVGWVFVVHGLGEGLRHALYEPAVFLLVLGLIVVSAAFHEFGHAAACAYGGAKPGVIGAGIYIAWPAFYTDVTDAYRLGRGGRLRTDLGGVYFNAIFSIVIFGFYLATGFEPLLLVVATQQFEMLHQLLPILRMDGYYILADLTGVPDLFRRVKPILRSLRPGRPPDPAVTELKPWVRWVVTAWIAVIVPVLLFNLVMLAIFLPRILATSWDSATMQVEAIGAGFNEGRPLAVLAGIVQIIALAIPITGIVLTLVRITKRLVTWMWDRPVLRVVGACAAVAVAIFALWPDGDYTPIQPGEQLRLQDVISHGLRGRSAPEPPAAPSDTDPAPDSGGDDGPARPPADESPPPANPGPGVTVTVPPVVPGVTVPPVTVPPVTLPPVTVPPVPSVPTTLPPVPSVPTTLPPLPSVPTTLPPPPVP